MGDGTHIQWTEATWNPLTGCEYASEGCLNCYAARETFGRLSQLPAYAGLAERGPDGIRFTGEIRLLPDRLEQPLRWRRPRRVFVNSMSDLFHRDVPDAYVHAVFDVMARARQHTFQVLTKRPQRMAALTHDRIATPDEVDDGYELGIVPGLWDTANSGLPAPNVWLGASIESDRFAFRADHVRRTAATVRFLSLEPLIGPLPSLDLTGIDWCIVGGESGSGARPMDPGWASDLRDRCAEAGVAYFFKQGGAHLAATWGCSDRKAGILDEVPDDLRVREYPTVAASLF